MWVSMHGRGMRREEGKYKKMKKMKRRGREKDKKEKGRGKKNKKERGRVGRQAGNRWACCPAKVQRKRTKTERTWRKQEKKKGKKKY